MPERNSFMFYQDNKSKCDECKGKCWVPNDQRQTQENAMKRFGIIPNNCVNGSDNEIHCPYIPAKL